MQKISILLLLGFGLMSSCQKKSVNSATQVKETLVNVGTHQLMTYRVDQKSKYLVVFEAGLGDGHETWNLTGKADGIEELANNLQSAILLYDRAGYGKSAYDSSPRNINQLRTELEKVINQFSASRKIVLVGHSVGGLIIRDYAIKNPTKIAALVFVDPTHENFNQPTQAMEDEAYQTFATAFGANSGAATEARQLIEDLQYTAPLPNLPNIPVTVLTSMKHDAANNAADATYHKTRQDWYNTHELLKRGVTDFTHVATTQAGHYIHREEPELFLNQLKGLLGKLP